MNYIVILDSGSKEIENLLMGTKSMIIHGANVECIPYGIVAEGDILYFVNNDNCNEVKAKGVVSSVYNSYRLSVEESFEMIIRNQDKLCLPDDQFYRWAGKKYLVLIELRDVEALQPFFINNSTFLSSCGWSPVGNYDDSFLQDRITA
jgi:hypothetical protein